MLFLVTKDGFPDQVFGIYTSTGRTGPPKFTPVALIEMKSPGIVYGLCSTFRLSNPPSPTAFLILANDTQKRVARVRSSTPPPTGSE